MFDNRNGWAIRRVKLGNQFKRGIGVVDVVVGQFLALMLGRRRNALTAGAIGIKRSRLVGIFTVTHRLLISASNGPKARRVEINRASHPCADGSIIGGGAAICSLRKFLAERQCGLAVVCVQLGQQRGVVLDISNHVHKRMVFGGRADHRRATNVDVLNTGIKIRTLGDGFFKRVQVHDQQIDWADVMLGHRVHMRRQITTGQKAAMHNRVQRFNPTIHHLRKACHIGHIAHV